MTPQQLASIGAVLYGDSWIGSMSAALGVNKRTVQRWITGGADIPDNLPSELATLCRERATELIEQWRRLREAGHAGGDPHAICTKWVQRLGSEFNPAKRGVEYPMRLWGTVLIEEYDADMRTLFSIAENPGECVLMALADAGLV